MIAHEYPGPLTKLFAYGLAGAVSVSRVTGNQHFPSDVLVGGAMGWLIAREMYHKHHDPDLGGAAWGSPSGEGDAGEVENLHNLALTLRSARQLDLPGPGEIGSAGVHPFGVPGYAALDTERVRALGGRSW